LNSSLSASPQLRDAAVLLKNRRHVVGGNRIAKSNVLIEDGDKV